MLESNVFDLMLFGYLPAGCYGYVVGGFWLWRLCGSPKVIIRTTQFNWYCNCQLELSLAIYFVKVSFSLFVRNIGDRDQLDKKMLEYTSTARGTFHNFLIFLMSVKEIAIFAIFVSRKLVFSIHSYFAQQEGIWPFYFYNWCRLLVVRAVFLIYFQGQIYGNNVSFSTASSRWQCLDHQLAGH